MKGSPTLHRRISLVGSHVVVRRTTREPEAKDGQSRRDTRDHEQDVSYTMALLATDSVACAVEVVQQRPKIPPKLLVAGETACRISRVEILPDPFARLRPVSRCGADIRPKAFVSDDFVGIVDNVTQGPSCLVHLSLCGEAEHCVLRLLVASVALTPTCHRQTAFRLTGDREPIRPVEIGAPMGIIAFIILGLLAGVIATAILPGDDPGGYIVTAIVGVMVALVGGFLAGALFGADPLHEFFDISTWLTAIVGSIILLALYRVVVDRGGGHEALRT